MNALQEIRQLTVCFLLFVQLFAHPVELVRGMYLTLHGEAVLSLNDDIKEGRKKVKFSDVAYPKSSSSLKCLHSFTVISCFNTVSADTELLV